MSYLLLACNGRVQIGTDLHHHRTLECMQTWRLVIRTLGLVHQVILVVQLWQGRLLASVI